MNKSDELREYAGEKYGDEVRKINLENSEFSTKLASMLKMMEAYYVCYSQNKREIVMFARKVALENAGDDKAYIKQIERTTKNKLNKIKNLDDRFGKFAKVFLDEFTEMFHGKQLEENLLDAFDAFWEENVFIEEGQVSVKKNLIK